MNHETKTGVYTRNGENFEFNFVTELSVYDKMRFISNVTNYLVRDDGYYSIAKDLFFDFMIVNMFTDIDLSYLNDVSNSVNEIEDFINDTKVVNIVKANMEDGLLDELKSGLNDNLAYRSGVNQNDFAYALSHLLKTIENKISGLDTESMMELAYKIGGISGDLTADKIVEAYSKTDAFKNNIKEVEDAKKAKESPKENIVKISDKIDKSKK